MEIMRGMSRRLRELTADYQEVCSTIGAWKDATDHGKKKSAGLMASIKKFADFFDEGLKAVPAADYFMMYYNGIF